MSYFRTFLSKFCPKWGRPLTAVEAVGGGGQSQDEDRNRTDDLRSQLVLDKSRQNVILPSPQGGSAVFGALPTVVGHTKVGYAFKLENTILDKR